MVGFSQKGKFARSVAAVAAELGLPRLLVDVRHEATHNDLPGLPLLRVAAELATAWLREHYWAAQRRHSSTQCTSTDTPLSRVRSRLPP